MKDELYFQIEDTDPKQYRLIWNTKVRRENLNELKERYTPIGIWQGGEEKEGHSINQV